MEKQSLFNIFKVFFKIGAVLLGGGYVIIPIMKDELIKKRNWLRDDEIVDYYCVSQCLPGIIAINMAIFVGYRLKKFKGAFVSLFAMSLSPFISIILIAHLIEGITDIPFIESVFQGINLSVIVLIYLALKDIWQKSIYDTFTVVWFLFILFLSALKISPVWLIIGSIFLGIVIEKAKRIKNAQR